MQAFSCPNVKIVSIDVLLWYMIRNATRLLQDSVGCMSMLSMDLSQLLDHIFSVQWIDDLSIHRVLSFSFWTASFKDYKFLACPELFAKLHTIDPSYVLSLWISQPGSNQATPTYIRWTLIKTQSMHLLWTRIMYSHLRVNQYQCIRMCLAW